MLNLKKDARTSFESQKSCWTIKGKFGNENFSFEVFTEDTVANETKNLSTGKASVSNYIPMSIMKETTDAYCPKVTQIMNDCLKNIFFPDRVRQLVYVAYLRTPTSIGVCMILDMHTLARLLIFSNVLMFSKFFWFL